MAVYGIKSMIYARIEELEAFPSSIKAQSMEAALLQERLQNNKTELRILYDLADVFTKHTADMQALPKPRVSYSQEARLTALKNKLSNVPAFEELTEETTLINYGNEFQAGLTPKEIALKYGVSVSSVVQKLRKLSSICYVYKINAGIVSLPKY